MIEEEMQAEETTVMDTGVPERLERTRNGVPETQGVSGVKRSESFGVEEETFESELFGQSPKGSKRTNSDDAAEETAQEWNDEEFVSAFDEAEESEPSGQSQEESKRTNSDVKPEGEKEESTEKTEGSGDTGKAKLEIGGREYTASDVEGLLSRLTDLQAAVNTVSPEREFVERLAAQSGMTVEAFLQDGERVMVQRQVEARTAQLMDQGMEESMARHVAELEVEHDAAKNAGNMRKSTETQAQGAQHEAEAQIRANVEEFARMYPEVKEFPDEVIKDIEQTGATPVVAYQKYLLREKEKELAAVRQAEKNRKQTTGSVKGTPKGAEDAFLLGFDSEFN